LAIRYAEDSISCFWKPCSMASTADPYEKTCSIRLVAAASTSSVIASIA
jgi:hypothetical protein